MTLIHPIVPVSANPAAVDPVRRVKRPGEDAQPDQRRDQRRTPTPRTPAATSGVTPDGHVDTRA